MADGNIVYKISALDLISGTLNSINAKTDRLDKSMKQLNSNTKSLSGSMKSLGKTMIATFAVSVIKGFVSQLIDAGTKVEDARIGMTTILKDASMAQKIVNETVKEAVKSPFDFQVLLRSKRLLLSTGSDIKTMTTLTNDLANAVAAVGGKDVNLDAVSRLMTKTISRGKVDQRTVTQFSTNFINLNKLYRDQSKKLYDENGKVSTSVKELVEVLHKAGQEGGTFYKGLENAQGSITSRLSNLRDQVFESFVEVFDDVRPEIVSVIEFMSDAITSVTTAMKESIDPIRNIIEFYRPVVEAIINGVIRIKDAIMNNMGAFEILFSYMGQLKPSLIELINILADIIVKVIDVIGFIIKLLDKIGLLRYIIDYVKTLVNVIKPVWELVKDILDLIMNIINLDWSKAWDSFVKGASDLWASLKAIWNLLTFTGNKATNGGGGDTQNALDYATGKKANIFGNELLGNTKGGKFNAIPLSETKGGKKEGTGVSGPKITSVTIAIETLINEFTVNTVNMKEGSEDIKRAVIVALSQAISDSMAVVV